jgi:hypothetical protein
MIRHAGEFLRYLRNFKYERTEDGLYFPAAKAIARGEYVHDVNGLDVQVDHNLLVDQGLIKMLAVMFGPDAKISSWYIALFSGSVSPANNWTAANFASTASEITSTTEGYTETTRQVFTPGTAAADSIDNTASRAAFTIATASQLNVTGAALLSSNVRGDTAGVLASATKFASTRVLNNTDVFNCGYRVTLSST